MLLLLLLLQIIVHDSSLPALFALSFAVMRDSLVPHRFVTGRLLFFAIKLSH